MNAIDRRINDLFALHPPTTGKDDLDEFWDRTWEQYKDRPLQISMEAVDVPFDGVEVYRVVYSGFDDTPVYGWYLIPRFKKRESYPCVVLYHGYTGGKRLPEQYTAWLLLGCAVFAVDVRGQGGETGNGLVQQGGMVKGWITQNITDKETCYYRAITVDAVRAVDWVAGRQEIDKGRIGVVGGSQGGGLALMAAIMSDKPSYAVADIPNMCHMDYGILYSTGSLTEAAEYVKRFPDQWDAVLDTLSYFDIMNLAEKLKIPVMVSVGLKDTVCMPETIFAAYNRMNSPKELHIYPFNGHEVGDLHYRKVLEYVKQRNEI